MVDSDSVDDYRISYLSDKMYWMLDEHINDFHKKIAQFDGSLYLDDASKSNDEGATESLNMLNSIGLLDYWFYEIFKPIGMNKDKYIRVRISTNGALDISGVVGLSDCEHWEWEHGSREYLRSLNNGNQRYMLLLSRPINDLSEENPGGSVIWWKPDKPEPLEDEGEEEELKVQEGERKMRYFLPYETERMLRWFGTTYIPIMDLDSIHKCTVCSIPKLSDDVQAPNFHLDATNIAANGMDLSRANIDNSTSLSLLTLAPKATVRVENHDERTYKSGQYLKFVVSGNQQTSNLSFHILGKAYNDIQEMNHYIATWEMMTSTCEFLLEHTMFLEVAALVHPGTKEAWNESHPTEEWIPEQWQRALDVMKDMWWNATQVDLLRFR